MKNVCTALALLFGGLIMANCHQTPVESPVLVRTESPGNVQLLDRKFVEFKGVSFHYSPKIFGNVRLEEIDAYPLKEPDWKPDRVAPEHLLFTFDFGREYSKKAHVSVYPLNKFPKMYSVNPESVKSIEEKIEALGKALNDKTYRLEGEIPHLPFADASQDFHSKVHHFNFENGKGILFVTHWSHGAGLLSNHNLIYRFEGLSDDGKFYVTAETPVSVDFLPDESPDEFEGHTYEDLFEDYKVPKSERKRFDTYINSITSRMEKLNAGDFRPNLETFESLISSLRIIK